MNVSFTGIRNASYNYLIQDRESNTRERYLNLQLKDDEYGNDRTIYREMMEKYPDFKPKILGNFINIKTTTVFDKKIIHVNGVAIPETDEFLGLYSYIGKLTKRISETPIEQMPVDRKYIISDYADTALLQGERFSEKIKMSYNDFLSESLNPNRVKKGAARICNDIQVCMLEYLA